MHCRKRQNVSLSTQITDDNSYFSLCLIKKYVFEIDIHKTCKFLPIFYLTEILITGSLTFRNPNLQIIL